MGDRSKLPQWARHEIERLESNAKHWEERAMEAAKSGDGRLSVGISFGLGETRRGLPSDTRIRFLMDPREPEATVDVYMDDRIGQVVVHTGRRLLMSPNSSNVLWVRSSTVREEREEYKAGRKGGIRP